MPKVTTLKTPQPSRAPAISAWTRMGVNLSLEEADEAALAGAITTADRLVHSARAAMRLATTDGIPQPTGKS